MSNEPAPKAAKQVAKQMDVIYDIPLDQIDDNPKRNIRKAKESYTPGTHKGPATELYLLAESLRTEGQLVPIIVQPARDHRYEVVAGFRRVQAARHLGWTSIRAYFRFGGRKDRKAWNGLENTARKPLTAPEMADLCWDLSFNEGFSHTEIGRKLGMGRTTVTNLVRIRQRIHPMVLDTWRSYPGRFRLRDLIQQAGRDQEEQIAWYRGQCSDIQGAPANSTGPTDRAGSADLTNSSKGDSKPKKRKTRPMATKAELLSFRTYLKSGYYDWPEDQIKGALFAVELALGRHRMPEPLRTPFTKGK